MADDVGTAIRKLLSKATTQFGEVAEFAVEGDARAVSVRPHREGTAAVHWQRFAGDTPCIVIYAGAGQWRFPDALETVEDMTDVLMTTAAGDAYEIPNSAQGTVLREPLVKNPLGLPLSNSTRLAVPPALGQVVLARLNPDGSWPFVPAGASSQQCYQPWLER